MVGGHAEALLGNFRGTGQHWGSSCGPAPESSRSLVTWFRGGFLLSGSVCKMMSGSLMKYLWQVAPR
ncbi:hypothetical protein L873DRAFT_262973 [Choiromyces venosus 120613-1]|uniref:Uncharacterized protein n=1 Tax=Choiromyces venosus 120613-1 TaxID=1336337 RepID=A0A3N4J419_9PEZI|nr:hypothetical protein L873DRAFT_262973 [Choiromyces venosus 120613-1]